MPGMVRLRPQRVLKDHANRAAWQTCAQAERKGRGDNIEA
jgi:hypothetical protein